MKIKNFKVVSKETNETQQGTIKGNTVVLNFGYKENEKPTNIGFSIIRGKEGDTDFAGNVAISGSVSASGDFNSYPHEPKRKGDFALIMAVAEICEEIMEVEEDGENKGK